MQGIQYLHGALGGLMAFLVGALAPALEGVAAQEAPPAEAFASLPTFRNIQVSPDGSKFAALVNIDEVYLLCVLEYAGGQISPLTCVQETEEFKARNPIWANDERLLFTMRFGDSRDRVETVETRLRSMSADGSDMFNLYEKARTDYVVQIQDRIVSLLPGEIDRILVQYGDGEPEPGVYSVAVNRSRVHAIKKRSTKDIYNWTADVHGEVMVGWGVVAERREKLIVQMSDGDWKDISDRANDPALNFSIVGVSDMPDVFYALALSQEGTDALYAYNAATDTLGEPIFSHPVSDVWSIVQDNASGRVLGVNLAEDESSVYWLEDNFVSDNLEQLASQFADYSVSIHSINMTETHAAIMLDQTNAPGFYLLYDMENKNGVTLPAQYPGLSDYQMGKVISTRYNARDGLSIPAYVTLPPRVASLEEAASLAFVIMPHGGPSARDFRTFNYWAQFLASRGYAVLQMNFRGSVGYGEEFRSAGDRQWGQAMQDDITDGAIWLIENGYADADRIAIMGGSYGGYAALMGAVKTPDLYQCAVSFAGVTDLPGLLREARDYVNGTYATRHIGNLWSDGTMLRENSPVNRANEIGIPVLLVHGAADRVVSIEQSERLAARLRRAGKDVSYVELPAGDHYLSLYRNRLRFLQETERFLGDCLSNPPL